MTATANSGTLAIVGTRHLESVITPGQLELLALYASGYTYEKIGITKFLSPLTVRNKIVLARKRSGARSTTHLCVALIDAGMIRMDRRDGHYKPVAQDMRIAG